MKLSVIVPVYNEEGTIREIPRQVRAVGLAHEVIAEGKKITWRDGPKAIWTLIKYRFVD